MTEGTKKDTTSTSTVTGRVEVIDGLRGLAICLVVLFHVWQISWIDYTAVLHSPFDLSFLPATGFFGVELFFFLSAFCLTLPYARHWLAGVPAPTLKHYIQRRIVKIVPSYWLVIFLLLIFLPDPGIPKERLWFHIWTHLLFIHNAFMDTNSSITGVLWSLAIEVQFYVLFPILLILFRRMPIATMIALVGTAFLWRTKYLLDFHRHHDQMLLIWQDNQLPSRLDVFAAGMAAAYVLVLLQRNPRTVRWMPLFTVLAVVSIVVFFAEMLNCFVRTRFDMPLILWSMRYRVLLSATLFCVGVTWSLAWRPLQKVLANPVLIFFSLISYNLYLWHQVVARWFQSHQIPAPVTANAHEDPHWEFMYTLVCWVASIAVATVLTWLWEMPFLRGAFPWQLPPFKDKASYKKPE